jgi:anhydro-N-acetylmuramic acid kinase
MSRQDRLSENTKPMTVMGLMSGTSVDGVDACLARLWMEAGSFRYEILALYSENMPEDLRSRLLKTMREQHISLAEWCALNVAVGELFAKTACGLMRQFSIDASEIDCIGSHGQTLFHWPPTEAGKLGGTLQIGEPTIIAEQTGVPTIADFRPGDMAAGGHGAPLVCFADSLLFADKAIGRCIQNIGGIANVTVLPATSVDLPIIAFDTGPGNMLIDAAMSHFYGKNYDANGAIAASGTLNNALFAQLMMHPYLEKPPPKTTGREDFGETFFSALLPQFPNLSPPDWLATLTRFTAESIAQAYQRWIFPNYTIKEIVIGGGGARNSFLLNCLTQHFEAMGRPIPIKTHADFGIPDQAKEALAFAILAWAARLGIPNNVPSCTGAKHPVVLGKLVL